MLGTGNPKVPLMLAQGQSTTRESRSEGPRAMNLQLLPEKGWRVPLGVGSQQDTPGSYFKEMETAFSSEGRTRETAAGRV